MTTEIPKSIPISTYPPVKLERPLKLFGGAFDVHISTPLTFSPNTFFKAAFGVSLREFTRKLDGGATDQLLKALWRGATKKNKLSDTTATLVKQKFSSFIPQDALAEMLTGQELSSQPPWQSDWEALLQGMDKLDDLEDDDYGYLFVERFAKLDRIAYEIWRDQKNDISNIFAEHIGNPQKAWKKYNPNLLMTVAMLVDISLQALARLEVEMQENQILYLLSPGKKPIGHWLDQIQKITSCSNLSDLSKKMALKKVIYKNKVISHDLLKKWTSGQQLIPPEAGGAVSKFTSYKNNSNQSFKLFIAARFMSFLCDLIIAGTKNEPLSWAEAQAQLLGRYRDLYDLGQRDIYLFPGTAPC